MIFNKIFIDTAPFVYIIENSNDFADSTENKISKFAQNSKFITSVITYAEFCVKPKKHNDKIVIEYFEKFLSNINCDLKNIDLPISNITADLRAKYTTLKTPDAIQLATAIYFNCNIFLTNDKKLKIVEEIKVVLVTD